MSAPSPPAAVEKHHTVSLVQQQQPRRRSVVVGGTSHPRSQRSVRSVGRHPLSRVQSESIFPIYNSDLCLERLPSLRHPVRCEGLGALALDSSPGPVGDAPAAPVPLGRAPYSHGAVVRGRREHVRIHRVPSDAIDGSAEKNFCHRSRYEAKTKAIVLTFWLSSSTNIALNCLIK